MKKTLFIIISFILMAFYLMQSCSPNPSSESNNPNDGKQILYEQTALDSGTNNKTKESIIEKIIVKDDSGKKPIGNLSGTWLVTDTPTSDCGDDKTTTITATITQINDKITLIYSENCKLTGLLKGNTFKLSGSCQEDQGNTMFNSMLGIVSTDLKKVTGTTDWTWNDGSDFCRGTSRYFAKKQ